MTQLIHNPVHRNSPVRPVLGDHPFRVGCLLTRLCEERPDLAALPANDPTLAAPVRALNDVADRIDSGICPRCAMVLLPTAYRPQGSRVTDCRCVPICDTCCEHEVRVRVVPVEEWPVPSVEQEVAARRGTVTLSTDEFNTVLSRAGRIAGPAVLSQYWFDQRIDRGTLAAAIGSVWSMAEFPDKALPCDVWVGMFRAAGFTVDGKPADLPAEPVRLWRGSTRLRRRLMSWTSDRAVAEKFASGGLLGREPGQVWTVLCPPSAVLCANTERGESEYVIDARGLTITEEAGR